MSKKKRILYIAPCWPMEHGTGTSLRAFHIIKALRAIGRVDCLVVKLADEPDFHPRPEDADLFRFCGLLKLKPLGARTVLQRLRCGLDPKFIAYHGHRARAEDQAFVRCKLQEYDLIWLHQIRTADVMGLWHWPRSVMDLDDVPSTYLRSVLREQGNPKPRLRAGAQLWVTRQRERRLAQRFTTISVCSEADREHLSLKTSVQVIPNGFTQPSQMPSRHVSDPPRIGFIGVFDYKPNAQGVRWFVERCWPGIKRAAPNARLRLAGRGSDGPPKPAGPDIDGLGWVKNSADEIATWSAMIVPVRTGAGTRIKIAEGFSRKCPVVSTSLGAYGYDAVNGRELLLADSPADFSRACLKTIREPQEVALMVERAWHQFSEKWTWEAIRPRILATAEDCLSKEEQPTSPQLSPRPELAQSI